MGSFSAHQSDRKSGWKITHSHIIPVSTESVLSSHFVCWFLYVCGLTENSASCVFPGPLEVDFALWINAIGDIDEKNMVRFDFLFSLSAFLKHFVYQP